MKIFGYGSLLCEDSFKSTVPEYKIIGVRTLEGYKRVFNIKSASRINPATGKYSSVLNLEKDNAHTVLGVLYQIPKHTYKALHLREEQYVLKNIFLKNGPLASVYISHVESEYPYVENDAIQKEYLDICLKASKKLGDEFLNNFLDSTFIQGSSLRELKF